MKLEIIKPIKALNKAYLKEKVSRNHIELFKKNLQQLLSRINEQESEEHLKNVIADFLKDTWYKDQFEINTKDRNDLVVHTGKTTKDAVGVILEVKKPSNKTEMVTVAKPNIKALQELILYYLRERVDHNNTDIKHLVVTNIYEWFVIDEVWFEKNVFRNSKLKKDYENWKLSGKDTKFFYDSIAKSFLDEVAEEMPATYFDVRTYEKYVTNTDKKDDTKLIGLYKILSPAHLLKQPFINDSNSLDTKFYTELLHIIGLEEIKDGGKKLIKRKAKSDEASLLENTIIKLEDKDALRNISNLSAFGANKEERLFNVALELCITWVNRVLFIKLLEAQLYKYHKSNSAYLFLNSKLVFDFDELSNLFFQVLAEKPESRRNHIQEKFSKVPYLNSSLFERIELERQTINVSELDNRLQLPLANTTVLKDDKGKRKTGTLPTLQYLFEFLDAYDFTSEGGEEIQEENKNLINASVLGLIFEKINGYKDGSFFTPGFVTMYMCKETIRRSVLQKFNDTKGWSCDTLDSLYNKIDDKKEANKIINSLHICDPAVGSGHFLVSALNEMIAIKSELKILQDAAGKSLRDYHVEVVNDELIITDEDGKLFDYNPQNKESQRIQETLFHEKETIIENCLFGVDINPNSVKICRLRLWIELLKNAYYTPASNYTELETLPNIDINIKCGNSLISRFALDADIKSALRNSKWSIDSYKVAVQTYRDAESKEQKREMEELIDAIKKDFRSYISPNDPKYKKLSKLRGDLFNLSQTKELFDEGNKKSKDTKKKIEQLSNEITKLETEIGEIKNNAIYENAFEWRFEFPEVLNDEGDYVGFDLIIGNPPYVFGGNEGISIKAKELFKEAFKSGSGKINLFTLFIEQSFRLLKNSGNFSFIIPNTFLRVTSYDESRRLLIQNHKVYNIYDFGNSVFEDAITTAVVIIASKETSDKNHEILINNNGVLNSIKQNEIADSNYLIALNIDPQKKALIEKLKKTAIDLGSICDELIFGVVITMNKDEVVSKIPKPGWKPFLEGRDIGAYYIKPIHSYLNYSPNLLHRARTKKIFEAPEKLIIQRITGGNQPLKVAYDNNKYYNKESINNIILKEDCLYNVKYILALLNSKLLNWFYTNQFTNESKLTVNLSKEYLSQLPIYKATKGEQENIILLVEKILELKRNDFNTDTSAFERRIDLLVFKLYGLNENEIKIVNGIK
ncbi:MAG TPA: TaqI-like C-terminal specificity domain-containing protein [Chitinophagaceae bacterium]|jgi:hypothetical protein|nr:TaqI-like C-terminal specificity domain-containing protein [Chitinophagaceae bacterium]